MSTTAPFELATAIGFHRLGQQQDGDGMHRPASFRVFSVARQGYFVTLGIPSVSVVSAA
ncbi:MAG: hypothetical protein ACT4OQ_01440 [Chloroflexota bacterium]